MSPWLRLPPRGNQWRWRLPARSPALLRPLPRCKSGERAAAPDTLLDRPAERTDPKYTRDLPVQGLLSTFYWYFVRGYNDKTHELQVLQKKMFGPIWKSQFGPFVIINVASAELIEEVLRQEGKYPMRAYMPHWREYRELRGQAYGPLCEYGKEWKHMRNILNFKMLKPTEVSSYSPAISQVVTEFVERIRWLKDNQGGGVLVNDVSGELYKFSFEAICSILFETRMGCLEQEIPEETQKFIEAVFEVFRTSAIVIFFPKAMWPYLSQWKRFVAAWDYVFYITEKLVNKKIKVMQETIDRGLSVKGEFLTYLLTSTTMTPLDTYGSLCELLLAAVDTTSNTISWTLYTLAKEPAIQQELYEEVTRVCPGDQIPVAKDFDNMPLLKAVTKEILRLYSPVASNARVLVEKDVLVGGHSFPKGTTFHLCHYAVSQDNNEFPQPKSFLPHRWFRNEGLMQHHPFASIPFGFGTRTCLGKRVAQLEIYNTVSRLIKHFEIRPDPSGKEVHSKTRTVLIPGSPINLQFTDRK